MNKKIKWYKPVGCERAATEGYTPGPWVACRRDPLRRLRAQVGWQWDMVVYPPKDY